MVRNVSFCGGETTGTISNRDTAKMETTGSIGVRREQPIDNKGLESDSVNFRGNMDYDEEKKSSVVGKIFGITIGAAAIIAALGAVQKYNLIGKLGDGKLKDFLSKAEVVTKPCYKWCHSINEFGQNQYKKIIDIIKGKKK